MKLPILAGALLALVCLAPRTTAQVVVVEPGHVATKLVDSVAPLHPSQTLLETTLPAGNIESIAVDQGSGRIFVQLNVPPLTTHVFEVTGGVVVPVSINTGLSINDRGTDMHYDPATNALVTQGGAFVGIAEVASIDVNLGTVGTYSLVTAPIFNGGTFGMQFSKGAGMSVVPAGDIVFTSDVVASGIHSVTAGGAGSTTHVPSAMMPGGGDDMIIQPNGDWVWIGDFNLPITSFSPQPPHVQTPSLLDLQTIWITNGLLFGCGSRGSACDSTGDFYVSFSCAPGGNAIFRIDAALTTATLVATIGGAAGQSGLHDLMVGPSSAVAGTSLYFTVHDNASGGEEVWELTVPECPVAECFLVIGEGPGQETFDAGIHTWQTQVRDVFDYYPVTLEGGPSFPVPMPPSLLPGHPSRVLMSEVPVPTSQVFAQILMWNPQVFPSNPEQFTSGLTITTWSNGAVSANPYGAEDNMTIWLHVYRGQGGQIFYRLPFSIDW